MFGRNPTRKVDHSEGTFLYVQGTPFRTIQGEGPFAGLPATFVRLWGCNLACHYCDTDFESDPRTMSIGEIGDACEGTKLVVLTGGEPFRQNIAPLCVHLYHRTFRVQIETAGNLWFPKGYYPVVPSIVVSPKTPAVHPSVLRNAIAWKYIIASTTAVDPDDGLPCSDTQERGAMRRLARPPALTDPSRVYVQPMDEQDEERNKANLARCMELAHQYGYRISLQQHKIIGVP